MWYASLNFLLSRRTVVIDLKNLANADGCTRNLRDSARKANRKEGAKMDVSVIGTEIKKNNFLILHSILIQFD
jgi:hypothetical protein